MNKEQLIRLIDKETKQESKEVTIEKLIFNQSDIEFEFGNQGEDNYGTLPYKDFLFFNDNYDVYVRLTK